MLPRRMGRLAGLLVAPLVLLPGCSDGSDTKKATSPSSTADRKALDDRLARLTGAGVFVGGVAFTGNLVAVHFDRRDEANPGMRVFLTDGLPGGNAEWFEGKATGNQFKFTAASGKATIEGRIEQFDTDGTVTLADGVTRNFFTRPAGDGAGAFEVTVGADGAWTGKSLDGSTLTARQQDNYVEGAVVTSQGNRYEFRHNDLTRRLGYTVQGGAPDTYMTIVTRQATEIQGRGGDIRGGKPSGNIVALDLHQTPKPTPGVYHGRVAFDTDRLNFEVAAPNSDGTRRVRAYVSDSEPEPKGHIEWFVENVTGSQFSMASKNGDAKMTGEITDEGISGEIMLPDSPAHRYFAVPSGQGAGIFTVDVAADRHHTGTSEQGAKLDLRYVDGTVMGTLTAPDGEQFPMLGADLATAFRYNQEFSKPGSYVAFVAPRGRYIYGRNGDVRAGHPGVNIIGLDKKC